MKIDILLIEDDLTTASIIYEFLSECGFRVTTVETATEGTSYIKNNTFDVILLDLNLPDFHGFEVLKSMKNKIAIPIIILSAYSETQTKVSAFKYGASDYLVKPIDLEELEARIWSLLGRSSKIEDSTRKDSFEISQRGIVFQGALLKLTTTEAQILQYLIQNKNNTITRDKLCEALSSLGNTRSLDHHIKNIRKKISSIKH
jgi:DNA-binding response OmpR family regulator